MSTDERRDWKAPWNALAEDMRAWVRAWKAYKNPDPPDHAGSSMESLEARMGALESSIRERLAREQEPREPGSPPTLGVTQRMLLMLLAEIIRKERDRALAAPTQGSEEPPEDDGTSQGPTRGQGALR